MFHLTLPYYKIEMNKTREMVNYGLNVKKAMKSCFHPIHVRLCLNFNLIFDTLFKNENQQKYPLKWSFI